MNNILYMTLALLTGLVLGTIFFGGLWLTVRKAVDSKIPAIWLSLSFIVRVGIILTGFYYISNNSWQRLLVCLLGFIIARIIVTYFTKSNERKQIKLEKEAGYEA